ncbi:hypothetical protein [Hallella colorans]|uniref:hypothetical protein n=1 Tax=Hallella colorans TaxID=1703337 RepID=UPI0010579437|nr:hypothetical protein [Hallella colorans]
MTHHRIAVMCSHQISLRHNRTRHNGRRDCGAGFLHRHHQPTKPTANHQSFRHQLTGLLANVIF